MTRNITLAIEEDVLEKARIIAARRKTTVNGLVREHLRQLTRQEDETRRALLELRAMSETTQGRLGSDYRFDREASHER